MEFIFNENFSSKEEDELCWKKIHYNVLWSNIKITVGE